MAQILETRSVLAVRDLAASTRFYLDVLGFRRDFGDGSDGWSFLSRDNCRVMLGACPDAPSAAEIGDHAYVAYLMVDDVDQLYEELSARLAEPVAAPVTEPWGLREFGIRTPDGHRLRFGERVVVQDD